MGFRIRSGTVRPQPITFTFDGVALEAYPGETLAAALIASDVRGFRRDLRGEPRGPYCNMGTCFECVLEVRDPVAVGSGTGSRAGGAWYTVRACLTRVQAGLEVRSRETPGIKDLGA